MELFFRELGSGRPFIIMHGLFGSSDNWLTLSKKFAEKNKIYLLDLRNHGNSFHADEFNYQAMAQDVVEFMKSQDLGESILLGHSMGGKVAMTVALNFPERVSKLVVADISPAAYPLRHDVIVEALCAVDLSKVNSRQDADKQLAEMVPEIGVRQFLLKNLIRKDGGYDWKINLAVIQEQIDNVGEEMDKDKTFDKPALFIKGGKSKYILDKDLPLIDKMFPKNQFKIIPGAGHWVHAEQPEEFYGFVDDFIKG